MTVTTLPVLRIGSTSWLLRKRVLITAATLLTLTILLFLIAVGISDYPMTPIDVARILLGGGTRVENVVVLETTLPRGAVAVLVGFGLGLSGSLTQLIARNPLATPDILGITAGAGATAVSAIGFGTGAGAWFAGIGIPMAALVGGFATAAVMYVLAWPGRAANAGIDPFRLVIIGVGMTWVLQAFTSWLLTRADITDAARAQTWLIGSVAQSGWSQVWPALAALVIAVVVIPALWPSIRMLDLGPDVAGGLGIRTGRVTAVLLITAVAISALCVSAAGPIAFVALLAPQIAMRLAGTPAPPPMQSGLLGAVLVVGADIACRTVLPGALPVGVVTAAIGGPFLIYLMITMSRRASV